VEAREGVLFPLLGPPRRRERLGQRGLLVEELSAPVPDPARLGEDHLAARRQQVGQHPLGALEEREPRLHAVELLAARQALPHRRPPRPPRRQRLRRGLDLGGGDELAAPEQGDGADVVQRTLVGDGERGEAVDLVAPQVDADRHVRRGGEHVDDPAAHGELAAVLDLVLAAVPPGHQLGEERADVDLLARPDDDRRGPDGGPQPLEQRADRSDDHPRGRRQRAVGRVRQRVQDGQAPPHRLDLGADALEGQRLPRRQDGDRSGESTDGLAGCGVALEREKAGQVVRQALGVEARRGDHEQRGPLRERRQRRDHDALRRLRDGHGGIGGPEDRTDHRLGAQQVRDGGQAAAGRRRRTGGVGRGHRSGGQ